MTDPLDVVTVDEVLALRTGKRVLRVMCTESGFDAAVTIYMSTRGKLKTNGDGEGSGPEVDPALALDESVIASVDALISDATKHEGQRHPHRAKARTCSEVRCRIDGVLHELREYPLNVAPRHHQPA